METIKYLEIFRSKRDVSNENIIKPGDQLSGHRLTMRKNTLQMGRPMKTGEVINDTNSWGDPFFVECEREGDFYLIWMKGNENEWFINDKTNFEANYEIIEQVNHDVFTCRKSMKVTAYVVDRPLTIYGKEQKKDPALAEPGDLVALDSVGDPYRVPFIFFKEHYEILEGTHPNL